MLIEVIATTVDDARRAEQGGANRIELVSGMLEGGLTPSIALVEQVVKAVSIPVHVMIRPHSRSFTYDEWDIEVILRDLQHIRQTGAAGVVFGALRLDETIDEILLQRFIEQSGTLNITFHRAFDRVADQLKSLETIGKYPQINRILTSGGEERVTDAIGKMTQLVQASEPLDLKILAGSGLNEENCVDFITKTNVREVHFGSAVREDRNPIAPIDVNTLQRIVRKIQQQLH